MGLRLTKPQQRGFVLIVVLCTIILLEVLLLGFNFRCRANLRAVERLRRSQQALNLARAGLNIAITAINNTPDIYTNKMLCELLSGQNSVTFEDGQCLIKLTDESGKLNVNLLRDKSGKLNRTRIEQLLRLIDLLNRQQPGVPYIGYGLAAAIIDWTDDDNQVTCLDFVKRQNLGAESDYYSKLEPPYKCKNKPLEVIDEMLLIKGVTSETFQRLRDYLTVNGDGKININCAPKLVIESLSEKMDTVLAQIIVDRRKIKPFGSIAELRDVPGMTDSIYNSIKNIVTVSPEEQYYHIESHGNVDYVGCTIDAILRRNPASESVEVVFYKELQ